MRSRRHYSTPLLACLLLLGCAGTEPPEDTSDFVLRASGTGTGEQGAVATSLSVSDKEGRPVHLDQAHPHFIVEAKADGGDWVSLGDVEAHFQGPHRIDAVVVADNSGSEAGELETMQEALDTFARHLLTREAADRVGLVRVSTEAATYQGLTEEKDVFDDAVARLFVTNGWTALWDGVRQANELLAGAPLVADEQGNGTTFCAERTHRAIVAFTDGRDNNSADEHDTPYPGDGIDTTFEHLTKLNVEGITTPVHWVGIGQYADTQALETMADATGARYVSVTHMGELHGALSSSAARLTSQVPLCFELPGCGRMELRLTVEFELDGVLKTLTVPHWLDADCSCDGQRRCTINEPG
jgi:hypothetical protein